MPVEARYGSQTKEVEALLARVRRLSRAECLRLAETTRHSPRHQGLTEAASIARGGHAGQSALADADAIILPLLRNHGLESGDAQDALTAVRMAAVALAGRDALDAEAFRVLYGPWSRAMGHWW
jgi:hypothetical protein